MVRCCPNPHVALTTLSVLTSNIPFYVLQYRSSQWCCKFWSIHIKCSILKSRQRPELYKQVAWSLLNDRSSWQFAKYVSVTLQEDFKSPDSSPDAFAFFLFYSNIAGPPVLSLHLHLGRFLLGLGCVFVLQKSQGAHTISYKPRDSMKIRMRTRCYSIIPLFPPVPHEASTAVFPFLQPPAQWNSSEYRYTQINAFLTTSLLGATVLLRGHQP